MSSQPEILTPDENKLGKAVSLRFKELRSEAKLKQSDAAERYGVGKSTWQRIEAGNLPTGALLAALADDGFNINWLLTGEGPMLRDEIEGIPKDIAQGAAIALADAYRASRNTVSDDTLRVMYDDYCQGFREILSLKD